MSSSTQQPSATSESTAEPATSQAAGWLGARALCQRELVRFFRQRNRVMGALGQPIIFWLLFGAGLGPSFRMPTTPGTTAAADSVSYFVYFFPGTVVLILLFTAIFSTISIIEDRREGFLQSVLVSPVPRWSMVLGKLAGGTLIAVLQAVVFVALGMTLGIAPSLLGWLAVVGWLLLVAFGLCGLGFVLAWRMDSTQGFHAVMNLLLMPMWLLSGAFFPATAGVLGWVVRLNPLTYGVAGLRRLLDAGGDPTLLAGLPSLPVCAAVTASFAAVMFGWSLLASRRRTTGDLL